MKIIKQFNEFITEEFKSNPWYTKQDNGNIVWNARYDSIKNLIRTLILGSDYAQELSYGRPGSEIPGDGTINDLIKSIEDLMDDLHINLRELRRDSKYQTIISKENQKITENTKSDDLVDELIEIDARIQKVSPKTDEEIKQWLKDANRLLNISNQIVKDLEEKVGIYNENIVHNISDRIDEGVLDYLQGKSEEDTYNILNKLSDNDKIKYIIMYQLDYDLLPRNWRGRCIYDGNLDCYNNDLTSLPDNLTVNGYLDCSYNKLTSLPDNLTVNGHLFCSYNKLTSLPDNLTVDGNLDCSYNKVKLELPKDVKIRGKFIN